MNRLIAAAAMLPALLATSAFAQTVSDEVNMQLWCGTAMVVVFSNAPPDATPDQLEQAKAFIDAGNALIEIAVQGHLDAGFTQEATDKIKADIVLVVTPQVMGNGDDAPYSFEDCQAILPGMESGAETSSSSAP